MVVNYLLVLSIMLLENIYSTGISHGDHHMKIHLQQSITLLVLSIMLLETSVTLLENIYSTGITHGDHHMMIHLQ